MNKWSFLYCLLPCCTLAQSFAPEPGAPGSTAIHVDSSIIVNWANSIELFRGPMDIQSPGAGLASYGNDVDALGMADGNPVSLGDGGTAIVKFPNALINGPGPDFAVFENGFADHYMELAHVEVSSDGINYFRFPSVSETPTTVQLTNFSYSNCAYLNNLAGKYRVLYGTPFDLDELSGISGLDVNNVSHLKLVDVIGSIDPGIGTVDSQGNVINDPYPTAFESGGFDLDAVAVLHELDDSGLGELAFEWSVYPNPVEDVLQVVAEGMDAWRLCDLRGTVLAKGTGALDEGIDFHTFPSGIYLLSVEVNQTLYTERIIKR